LIEITPQQVTPALISLFKVDAPTGIRALAVLAGGIAGRIFTDNPACPHCSLVWERDDGTLYRGGKVDRQILAEVVALLRQEHLVAVGFRPDDLVQAILPPEPQAGAQCLEFDRSIGAGDLSPFLDGLPAGYTLRRMDRTLIERSRGGHIGPPLRCGGRGAPACAPMNF
jgi:hypothetical protein